MLYPQIAENHNLLDLKIQIHHYPREALLHLDLLIT